MAKGKARNKGMTTSITLEESLYKSAKHYAVENNKTLKDVMTDALNEYLHNHSVLEKQN